MLPVLITIDTEYSSGFYRSGEGRDRAGNFDRTIAFRSAACRSPRAEAGIFHQMEVFDRHGITGVFFVDPMPALVWGQEAVDAVVQPIIAAGHEVQLHCHTEWLDFAEGNPFGPERGQNIKDFARQTQADMLGWASERLVEAGAPAPTAFRAGNYGANDDTLGALAGLGIAIDSSFAPGFVGSCCEIALPMGRCEPVTQHGVTEWPIAAIEAREGWRHGQLTALSFGEMRAAVRHAAASNWPAFILVSHSFELFDRAKQRPNPVLMRRFADFCEWLGTSDIAKGTGFAALPEIETGVQAPLMPHNPLRTMRRMAEQMLANAL